MAAKLREYDEKYIFTSFYQYLVIYVLILGCACNSLRFCSFLTNAMYTGSPRLSIDSKWPP